MYLSKLFTKTRKDISKDETAVNAKLLERAGFVEKEMAGVYSYLPLGLLMLKNIENIVREEINKIGGQEILMPTLTSIESYKTTKRDKIDVLFKTKLHSGSEFVLNQSHEEVITPLLQKFARSYKDLPCYVYQIQTKFRNEPRAKSGLLRGREFLMKDLYSFHANEKDLDQYYEEAKEAYKRIFDRLGYGNKTYLTYASGGTFSKYSHEFQTLCENGEDTIYLCEKCKVAVNKEIIEEQKTCPKCGNDNLVEKKAIEVGNIFKLKIKFSEAFKYNYVDQDGKQKPVIMGCYGIGISRQMGTIVEVFHDETGMILPESVAPFKYHIVQLKVESEKLKAIIEKLGGEENCLIDDREASAGQKFADADLMGMPYRIVISEKTLKEDSVEVKKRSEKEGKLVKIEALKNI